MGVCLKIFSAIHLIDAIALPGRDRKDQHQSGEPLVMSLREPIRKPNFSPLSRKSDTNPLQRHGSSETE
ncbi:hypothetical protein MC7420_181 [Coleofasciculus chthonoplastes PCC 7420]|uniref:Uncharacterized protein n=1 Tax=Coleofasciculus chthonoplastes PCC 7420 TaxID=118168 RepID=B4VM04_9CYAN|nr:hypothetical protein MC7420_181 [Coleofasciculus chthonoplastes PCC 7420]